MTKDEIITKLKETISEILAGISVEIRLVNKNNNTNYIGVVIGDKGDNNVQPVMDVTSIVEEVLKKQMDIKQASEKVVEDYSRVQPVSFNYIPSREDILDTVFCQLINYDLNREFLRDIPHQKYLDLAVVYRYRPDIDGIDGTILITNNLLEGLDVDACEVEEAAYDNAMENDYLVMDMAKMLMDKYEIDVGFDNMPMFVCSSYDMTYGARVLLNKKIFHKFGYNLYIIPSSVHEIIVIPATLAEPEYIREIIGTVNRDCVEAQDVLSDNLYFYNYKHDEISIIEVDES